MELDKNTKIKLGVAIGGLVIAGGLITWQLTSQPKEGIQPVPTASKTPATPEKPKADPAAKPYERPLERQGGGYVPGGTGGK